MYHILIQLYSAFTVCGRSHSRLRPIDYLANDDVLLLSYLNNLSDLLLLLLLLLLLIFSPRPRTWRRRTRTGWATPTSASPSSPTRNIDSRPRSSGELSTRAGTKHSTLKVRNRSSLLPCLAIARKVQETVVGCQLVSFINSPNFEITCCTLKNLAGRHGYRNIPWKDKPELESRRVLILCQGRNLLYRH